MKPFADDVRFAYRSLRRVPGFVLTTIAVLAIGVGATTAVWSVAEVVLLRNLPIRDQSRVIAMWGTAPGSTSEVPTLTARYQRFRTATKTLEAVGGFAHYGSVLVPLEDNGTPLRGREALVTGNFFDVLGTRPVLGRLLRLEDDVAGAAPVMVLSEAFWRSSFAADPTVIGRHIRILNREIGATIIGVAPAGLTYPSGADFWFPIAPTRYPGVDLIGRLAPGATLLTARAELAAFVANDNQTHGADQYARSLLVTGVEAHPLTELIVGPARQPLFILTMAVAGLLLIACVNIGNLLLVRATQRSRELAIRRALGASSSRLATQLGVEVCILAAAGAAFGGAVAFALLRLLVIAAPAGLPRLDEITLSPTAFGAATLAAMVTLLLAGVLPAAVAGESLSVALRSDVRSGGEQRARRALRSVLVAGQIALALVLLATSALLARSLLRLQGINLGYVPAHLSIVQVTVPFHKYRTADEFNAAFDDAQRRIRAIPGVSAITPVLAVPFLGTNVFAARVESRDHPELGGGNAPYVSWDAVGPDFSRAMDVPLVRGRGISEQDRAGSPPVAVVTQDLANRYWPGQDPIGRQLRLAASASDTAWRTVVGVVRPLNYRTMREATPTVLFSYHQEFQQGIFAVRSSRDVATILPELRTAFRQADRDIVLWRAQTMDQLLAAPLSRPRLETFLLTAFAVLAIVLAATGLYGVVAYLVRTHMREFGIRIALGASKGDVVRLALGNALRVAAAGIAIGTALSIIAARLFAAELFEVSPGDPLAFAGAGALLIIAVLVASYIPARRAAHVDPVRALRSE